MNKVLLGICLILCGCSKKQMSLSENPTRVNAAVAQEREVSIYVTAIGNIIEHSIVQIKPQVQGILTKAYVKQGQQVKAGELLYEIEAAPYQAAVEEATGTLEKSKATLEQAKITVHRNETLVEKNYIPKLNYEQFETNVKTAEAEVTIAQADLKKAQINLGFTKISSPINGYLSLFNIYPGTFVSVNDTKAITEIRELDPIDVQFSVPQTEFQKMQQVQSNWPLKFEAILPDQPDKKYEGIISFIDNHIDLSTGTLLLKGIIENKEGDLWPGEFVHVRIFLRKEPHALVIPASALQIGSKGSFVYVVQADKTAIATPVETGETINSDIVILSGLKPGDTVVTNGQINLKNDSKVEIIEGPK